MKPPIESPDHRIETLLRHARDGDQPARDELFSLHDEKLRRMIRVRLDPRIQGRLDETDILQEVYLEAFRRLPEYIAEGERRLPFLLWLRFLAGQALVNLHRHHLEAMARDPRREIHLAAAVMPSATSNVLAAQLAGKWSTPSQEAMREELRQRLFELLESMEPREREIIALRHFEQLSNQEAARELGIDESAASKRYLRAIARLKGILTSVPGGLSQWL